MQPRLAPVLILAAATGLALPALAAGTADAAPADSRANGLGLLDY